MPFDACVTPHLSWMPVDSEKVRCRQGTSNDDETAILNSQAMGVDSCGTPGRFGVGVVLPQISVNVGAVAYPDAHIGILAKLG